MTISKEVEQEVLNKSLPQCVVVYVCLPFPSENKDLSKKRSELKNHCKQKGWKVSYSISEVGSGIQPNRKGLQKVLRDTAITTLVIDTENSLSKHDFSYIETLLKQRGCKIHVANTSSILTEKQLEKSEVITQVFLYASRYGNTYRAGLLANEILQILEKEVG